MPNKSGNEPKARKKRQLNVIYFVDSARTRSFRVPLSRVNALIAFFMGLFVWAVISIFMLSALVNDRQELSQRFTDALNTIFKYETSYDSAYEIAYSKSNIRKKYAEAQKKSIDNSPAAAKEDTNPVEVTSEKKEVVTKVDKNPEMALSSNSVKQETNIDVVDAKASLSGKNLKLVFKIINKKSPKKMTGFVHAIAEFVHTDGRKEFFGAPNGIDVSSAGVAQKPSFAYKFSIRRFKVKKFQFKLPKNIKGTIKNIRIELTKEEGTVVGLFKVPMGIKVK